MEIILYDEKGDKKTLPKEIAGIFDSLHKNLISLLIYVLKILLRKGDVYSIYLMIKGGIKEMFGIYPSISNTEVNRIISNVLNFNIRFVEIGEPKLKFLVLNVAELTGIHMLIREIIFQNGYNIPEKNIRGKTGIDAGANIGVFSLYAAKLGAKKIYAFEPVQETFNILKENIALNGLENIITPINKGLGEKNEIKNIYYRGIGEDGTASFVIKHKFFTKSTSVEIVKLDDFIKDEEINFIKIDTEGYEENILLGAKEIIKKYRPILSFSVYHKPNDKERLPKIVKQIRGDYNCALLKKYKKVFYCE